MDLNLNEMNKDAYYDPNAQFGKFIEHFRMLWTRKRNLALPTLRERFSTEHSPLEERDARFVVWCGV